MMMEFPDGSFRAHSAVVAAEVRIGKLSNLWFNVVVRGDMAPIVIGQKVNVQDGAVVHCDGGVENVIEDGVTIGHGAVCHGSMVGRGTLVGMRAVLLGRTKIGAECIIGAGAVVSPGMEVPERSVVMGVPGRVVRKVKEEELEGMRWVIERYVELARRYASGEIVAGC